MTDPPTLEQAFRQLKQGYFENALESFTDYLLVDAEEAKAYQGRAMASFQLNQWASAVSDFQKAKELDPADLENWVGLAMSLAMENKIYEAVDVFEELLSRHPTFVRGHVQLGLLYYRLGVITKGHQQMDWALACRPPLAERRLIEQSKKEQVALDKKRYYRPDFEALRETDRTNLFSHWMEKIKNFLKERRGH